ncbi:unnamed protein product [Cuscuta campestris]|uniref:Exonuclease domain-containing protein n=1 Tax=Cuscuta campestris TaxID=132261 RepID=A0A484K9D5_9ASTE|nr:unnamed protein product [Cuscuta campestris]
MDALIASAKKDVLVHLVKLSQKCGMKGSKGRWKDFLQFYDKKFGFSMSDPARRSVEDLAAFLKTFSQDEDLKIFEKVLQCHANRDAMIEFQKRSENCESPEQRLVCSTLNHPQYAVDYSLPSYEEGWLVTKCSKKSKGMKSTKMLAIDCEMALCKDGTEALIRVCVVDQNFKVKLDKFVKPSKTITDYRTDITGINASDLDGVTCSLNDVQESMKKLLAHGKILVGHGLCNDLRALQIDHAKVIDTAYVFKYQDAPNRRPSLSNLCKFVLGYELRENGCPHNCLDDAIAAMKLVKKKVEHDFDDSIPFTPREEGGEEKDRMAKLLIHRIPLGIRRTGLHEIISGEFTIQMKYKAYRKQLGKYSAFAIFKNQQEANEAYEKLEGTQEKDTFGRPQKLVSFQLDTGVSGSLCVRNMACGDPDENPTAKRSLQDEEEPLEEKSKKVKTDHLHRDDQGEEEEEELGMNNGSECGAHSAEIERLK